MATSGTSDNVQSFIKRAGTVADANITSVTHAGPRIFNPTPADDGRILPRDSEVDLGDRSMQKSTQVRTYTHIRTQAASGYDIHGQLIEAAVSTDTTFAVDEASDDDARVDNGEWLFMRSNTINSETYPLKIQ